MKRTQKPSEQDLAPALRTQPREEAIRLKLEIEELEPRLAPQSTAAILE
jgi:hypothetical protein